MQSSIDRVPVILVTPSFVEGARIFDPNSWRGGSKGIIQSCGAEYSALHHCVTELIGMCKRAEGLCRSQVEDLIANWKRARFDISRCDYFVEAPAYHLQVESFFSSVKSLLDLIVQLLQSERIVGAEVHGFHSDGDAPGGRFLKILNRNMRKDKREIAQRIADFLREHKVEWIDKLVRLRDDLVHPAKGMMQVMFQVDLTEKDGGLVWQVREPAIATYAPATLTKMQDFCDSFIALIQGMAPNPERDMA